MNIESVIADIDKTFEDERSRWPCHSNRASQLGTPCVRQLVYYRLEWEKAQMPRLDLIKTFNEGRDQEQIIKRRLEKAGYKILRSENAMVDSLLKKYQITGHQDFFIQKENESPILVEFKSSSPNIFPQVNCMDDWDQYSWGQKYKAQMQIYMFGNEVEKAWMILKNKSNGQIKILEEILDLDYVEKLLRKAEFINQCVESKKLPERNQNEKNCKDCPFNHLCMPPILNEGVEELDDKELEELLNIRNENEIPAKDFKKADKRIKEIMKTYKGTSYLVGEEWLIEKKVTKSCTTITIKKIEEV